MHDSRSVSASRRKRRSQRSPVPLDEPPQSRGAATDSAGNVVCRDHVFLEPHSISADSVAWLLDASNAIAEAIVLRIALAGGVDAFTALMRHIATECLRKGMPWLAGVAVCMAHVTATDARADAQKLFVSKIPVSGGNILDIPGGPRGTRNIFRDMAGCLWLYRNLGARAADPLSNGHDRIGSLVKLLG